MDSWHSLRSHRGRTGRFQRLSGVLLVGLAALLHRYGLERIQAIGGDTPV